MKYIINNDTSPESLNFIVQPSRPTDDDILLGDWDTFAVRLTVDEEESDVWLTRSETRDLINALEMVLDS
jgi:hypothetical protein